MHKKLFLVLMLAIGLSACKKNKNNIACGTQTCTASFAVIMLSFTDANGEPTPIENVSVVNLRTNEPVPPTSYGITMNFVPGVRIIATDETKSAFSTQGDDVRVTATSTVTGKTKRVTLKVSGGCNCHVERLSGPETVKFD